MSTEAAAPSPRRLSAVLRHGEAEVTRLELFFDLVFVLAITQVTALMADEPTWEGLAKGVLVLGVLLGPGIVTAAVVGTAIAAALWWLYFDVVALVAERRLAEAQPGREQNAMARDSYSFLHFPMVAGIVLVALGMKKTIGHVEDPLKLIPAVALYGGAATYLLAHVAFRYRHIHSINTRRLAMAVLLVALIAVGVEIPALASATIVAVVLIVLIVIETRSYGDSRARIRNELRAGG